VRLVQFGVLPTSAPASVAGEAEDFFFQGGAGGGIDAPGQAQVFGLLAG
jgi:hypothetical protein